MTKTVRTFALAATADGWQVQERHNTPSGVQLEHCSGSGVFSSLLQPISPPGTGLQQRSKHTSYFGSSQETCAHAFVLQNHVRIGHSIMMALAANPTPKLIWLPPSLISHQHSQQALYLCQTMLQKCTSCSHQVTTMSHHMHGFFGQQHGFQYQSSLQLSVCSSNVACLAL